MNFTAISLYIYILIHSALTLKDYGTGFRPGGPGAAAGQYTARQGATSAFLQGPSWILTRYSNVRSGAEPAGTL